MRALGSVNVLRGIDSEWQQVVTLSQCSKLGLYEIGARSPLALPAAGVTAGVELADPETPRFLLSGAGWSVSALEQREFAVSIPAEDYLTSRSLAMTARFMKKTLSAAELRRFEGLARQRLVARFGSHFELTTRVNTAVAARERQDESSSHSV